MCSSSFEDQSDFLSKAAAAEEEDHDEGVGEADFGAVHGAIAGGFKDAEEWVEGGGEDEGFEGGEKGL